MPSQLHLHDQVATGLLWEDDILYLELKKYNDTEKTYTPYNIVFYGVNVMQVDHVQSSHVTTPTDSGDVLRFRESNGMASLLIEWHDFGNKTKSTKLYEFSFDHWQIKNAL